MATRLSPEAWLMLQRLAQVDSAVCFAEGRYYFALRQKLTDVVRTSTIEALTRTGFLRRERTIEPWYVISENGITALRRKKETVEVPHSEMGGIRRITLAAHEADR